MSGLAISSDCAFSNSSRWVELCDRQPGSSGVEMAATLADLLPTWYIPLGGKPQDIRIVILQRGFEILKESASDRLRETAQSALQQRTASVEVLLESEVKAVHPGTVEFERNGQLERLAAATVVWTTGNATHPVD
ncbi:hypothetical protein [Nostoc sp.]|uniref:hypothetical protein n=1 Tax=Nostoc sp. TaxID=1180 RepID=UPI002FF5C5B4